MFKFITSSCMLFSISFSVLALENQPKKVDLSNFARAETDMYFNKNVAENGIGNLVHVREPASINNQTVVRMNRDTLYSTGVFDLESGPVTIVLPDVGKRYMALQIINQDHYTQDVVYAPTTYVLDKKKIGTRYAQALIRTLVNPEDPKDIKQVHNEQDKIIVFQDEKGLFEIPNWDDTSRTALRNSLSDLAKFGGMSINKFGKKEEVDPLSFIIATATGWGGNPSYAAVYTSVYPKLNNGKQPYILTVKDVPVDGFWSISVYDSKGYFVKNNLNAYSLNNITAKANNDGSYTIQFGECSKSINNCLPIYKDWNYTIRLYQPHKSILNNTWKFPDAEPLKK